MGVVPRASGRSRLYGEDRKRGACVENLWPMSPQFRGGRLGLSVLVQDVV